MSKTFTRRNALKTIGVGAGACSLAGVSGLSHAKSKPKVKMRMQTHWPTGVSYHDEVFVEFCDMVKEASGGEIEIKPFPPNSIIPTKDVFQAVSNGMLDSALIWPSYWTGKIPVAAHLNGFPFTWRNSEEAGMFFYEMGALEIIQEAYAEHNIHNVGPVFLNGITLYSKKPLRTLEDFKGFKVRSTGPAQKMFQKAGATPVFFSGSELYSALQRGVCEGAHWGATYAGWQMKLQEVTSYLITPYLAQVNNGEIFFNKDKWDSLPKDYQQLISSCAKAISNHCMEWFMYKDYQCREDYKQQNMGEIIEMEKSCVNKLREYSVQVIDDFSKKESKYTPKVGKILKEYMDMAGQI